MFNEFLNIVSDLASEFSIFLESLPYAPGMELGDSLIYLGYNLFYAFAVCSVIALPFLVVAYVIRLVCRGFN